MNFSYIKTNMYPYFVVLSLLFNEHKYSRSSVQRKKKTHLYASALLILLK